MDENISALTVEKKLFGLATGNRFMGLIFILVGLGICGFGLSILNKGHSSLSWPISEGTIVHSDIDKKWSSAKHESGRKIWRHKYSSDIHYTYKVKGNSYRANNIRLLKFWTSSKQEVENEVKKYPKWKKVKVYYNPNDPKDAMLEPGIILLDYFVAAIGLAFFMMGLLIAIKTQ